MQCRAATSPAARPPHAVTDALDRILGTLNFSSGGAEGPLALGFDALVRELGRPRPAVLRDHLRRRLTELTAAGGAFADSRQADAVLDGLFETLAAYREFHRDLLPDLTEQTLASPFFLAAVADAVLTTGTPFAGPVANAEAVALLNDFVGHRPIPTLRGGERSEIQPHERHHPLPLYRDDAGFADHEYETLLRATFDLLRGTPADLLDRGFFALDRVEELSLDLRTYDDRHPVFKRTNYLFGEWDPERIDLHGDYRRFVLRRPVLEAIVAWQHGGGNSTAVGRLAGDRGERLFDAAAALAGTILMASAVGGRGPDTFDSGVSLMTLLPQIAGLRDEFYDWLIEQQSGARAKRLAAVKRSTRQPFGNVRQYLNLTIADLAARQAQSREVATQYVRLGRPSAARREAASNPGAAGRIETSIECRLSEGAAECEAGRFAAAAGHWVAAEELVRRGVACGLLPDPWTVLGFQGQYPLFRAREDSLPDPRLDVLVAMVGRTLGLGAEITASAAAAAAGPPAPGFGERLRRFASWWDRFATTSVADLPAVHGERAVAAAERVAAVLADWRRAGGADADLRFWRDRVDALDRGESLARAVTTLLGTGDRDSAAGLLFYWLGESEQFGLGREEDSVFALLGRLFRDELDPAGGTEEDRRRAVRRFFDRLGANSDHLELTVPAEQESAAIWGMDADDGDDPVFAAAYDGMTFHDSGDDGVDSDLLDEPGPDDVSDGVPELAREWEGPLRFREAAAHLWRDATLLVPPASPAGDDADDLSATVREWVGRLSRMRDDLMRLSAGVAERPAGDAGGDEVENMLRDERLQIRHRLVHRMLAVAAELAVSVRLMRAWLDPTADGAEGAGPPGGRRKAKSGGAEFETAAHRLAASLLRRDRVQARRAFRLFAARLRKRRLLYVPPDRGGDLGRAAASRADWRLLELLAAELPRVGLLAESHALLGAVLRSEQRSRTSGPVVTEFDRLFRRTLSAATGSVVRSVETRRANGPRRPRRAPTRRDLDPRRVGRRTIGAVAGSSLRPFDRLARPFRSLWLAHSRTLRLSVAEVLRDPGLRKELEAFIARYGADLLHARNLTLGHVRMVLHTGVGGFLDGLVRDPDPLRPIKLVDDLLDGTIDRDRAAKLLTAIYQIVVEKVDRWIEYNSLTTRSDYGNRFFCLLDFLRVEVDYERDEWNLTPDSVVFRRLARDGRFDLADRWLRRTRRRTRRRAARHLSRLAEREGRYGVVLPGVRERMEERLVGPLVRERLAALVAPALRGGHGEPSRVWFDRLREEVNRRRHLGRPAGPEPPEWLDRLEEEVRRQLRTAAPPLHIPAVTLSREDLSMQLRTLGGE